MKFSVSATPQEFFKRDLADSLYSEWNGTEFRRVFTPHKDLPATAKNAFADFHAHISNESFSCIGAKAALHGGLFRLGFYDVMNAPETNRTLAHDLCTFAAEQKKSASNYTSFAAVFDEPSIENESVWESSLWAQLKNLHEIDRREFVWDANVSSNPDDPNFSFSIAGTGFFIVGLHPASSRLARRFSRAALVFNPHAQFDRLRENGQYNRIQQTIRAREMKLQNSLNPNLSDFGTQSEARQYSGRAVEENWKCPFHAQIEQAKKARK